ncbi:hypothetical protein [Virgibacillus sp. DJP39]|uniref:hypothetical protein n=1 Tax=Virgibacillus sp. DJP39 TaxID=3409790 RepID=UPI003BB4D680
MVKGRPIINRPGKESTVRWKYQPSWPGIDRYTELSTVLAGNRPLYGSINRPGKISTVIRKYQPSWQDINRYTELSTVLARYQPLYGTINRPGPLSTPVVYYQTKKAGAINFAPAFFLVIYLVH